MLKTPDDLARYLPVSDEQSAWGLSLRGIGRITNAPGAPYPPKGHPGDHAFTWKHGRVLGAWQLVLISAGGGECEFGRGGGVRPVPTGSVIVVAPGQWHRYRPTADTGWSERWIEFDGRTVRDLSEAGLLPRHGNVRMTNNLPAMLDLWEELAGMVGGGNRNATPAEIAAALLRLLGWLAAPPETRASPPARAVRRAEHILAERLDAPPSMPALAREVGVSYAVFRREFRKRTGRSPRRHLLDLRLERARRLIGNTPMRLEAVAEQTGFSSAFHLSAAFKKRFGVSPAVWRRGQG